MATPLKVEKFPSPQRAAPERVEKHELESALRAAQVAYDYQLHDLRSEFLMREGKLREEYLNRINQITSGE